MTQFNIPRTFAKRDGTEFGTVRLEADVNTVKVDGNALPDSSIEYLLTFSLQSLQDAYAGKDGDDAKKAFADKLARLVAGDIGTRGGGTVSVETAIARQIMRDIFKAKASKADLDAYKAADADGRNAMIDERIARNQTAVDAMVEEEVKRRAAARAKLAKVELDV